MVICEFKMWVLEPLDLIGSYFFYALHGVSEWFGLVVWGWCYGFLWIANMKGMVAKGYPRFESQNLPTQTPGSISCIQVGDMSYYYLMLRIIRWFALKLGKG